MNGFSMEEVFQAYFDCRKNKRNTAAQVAFEQRLERNLMQIYRELSDRSYEIGRTRAFVVTEPKVREVWAGQFRDRVVHHVMYNRIFERFHKKFINDTYACIPGRGVLHGAGRIHGFMRRATENWQKKAWFLQCDLKNFFVSIDKDVLWELSSPLLHEPEIRWITHKIIYHDPTDNPILTSPRHLYHQVPWHKSLFNSQGRGLPIGNLSSQYFANVHLNPLDQFIKRDLGVKFYGRYVDDLILIGRDPQWLSECFKAMQEFAEKKLRVEFHPNKTITNTVDRGVNFCGQILKPWRNYVRSRTARSMRRSGMSCERYQDRKLWKSRVNSYLGFCRHACTYRLRKNLAMLTGAWFSQDLKKIA